MIHVLVTGANGQMGQALQSIGHQFPTIRFVFLSKQDLDILNIASCLAVFEIHQPTICINFAAYTNVEKAEEECELAYQVNAEACKNLAEACLTYDVTLLHISTDFVFDGEKTEPYTVTDSPNPINVYGASKLKGEQYIQAMMEKYYIVRTSWVYSEFGHNFRNTMLKLAETNSEINVVDDQIGCPTQALEVVHFVVQLILDNEAFGLYHYRGERCCSWYDFALSIFEKEKIKIQVNRISSKDYLSKAKRPKYSVLG
ncbi:dTDP-4-dehydrorhamnose reductase [Myroides fluvii]|uniref:dTDP-4-dehydrorhamnose reductase n=1 Tax=Myroides fluvii TaxID=2572594 RepID=UPI00131E587A|nr:dTDP-4-dehydrorhamnose reductase [Myroides fluvii]